MLASPLLPAAPIFTASRVADDSSPQYRPARDLEAFNSLLGPAIEFVEGSSSGALAVPIGKYEPINASPKTSKADLPEKPKISTTAPTTAGGASPQNPKRKILHSGGIDISWPDNFNRGSGLCNIGNTCFLNSALQCLLHTPPLLRMLLAHDVEHCKAKTKGFSIAKHLRRGRQEDSHEFLRYAIDGLQKSCLAGHPPKVEPKVAETTWVHKIFGGKLRSRVTCQSCGYNSDTFDQVLDISVDIHQQDTLRDALKKFIAIDHLKGSNKYKCEKCKKHVNAEKQFTVHEAPVVLTVHLKRFSPMGRKLTNPVRYDDDLSLQPYMSENQFGPSYSLYGVICHAGSGPHSGHYYAFVKSGDGRWWEMNDESVSPAGASSHWKKSAYMLFYIRKKGQGLEAAVNSAAPQPTQLSRPSLVSGMKKRKEREEANEDLGTKVPATFIGPLLPTSTQEASGSEAKRPKLSGSDPQAELVKKKIAAAASLKAKTALTSLSAYDSDGEKDEDNNDETEVQKATQNVSSSTPPTPSSNIHTSSPISPARFHNLEKSKERKHHDKQARRSGHRGSDFHPWGKLPFARDKLKRRSMAV
ncbi:hypothetical protein H0H93_000017 [Arthromyces matolae]|nr:hypothetical protein H0H93_000017 [Arthromyces matolae]